MPAANSKSYDGLQVTVPEYLGEKAHIPSGTLRMKSMFHCRAQTIVEIAQFSYCGAILATAFLATYGKQSARGNSNTYSKEMYKSRHSWKAAFLLIFILY